MVLVVTLYTNTYDPNSILFCAKSVFFLPYAIVNGLIALDMLFLNEKWLNRSTAPSTSYFDTSLVYHLYGAL